MLKLSIKRFSFERLLIKRSSINMKLLIFPLIFLIIILIFGFTNSYFTSKAKLGVETAITIDKYIIKALHARITAKEFSNNIDEDTADKVKDDFKRLYTDVSKLKDIKLEFIQENFESINEILKDIKEYQDLFDKYSKQKISNSRNKIYKDTNEIETMLGQMMDSTQAIERSLNKIHNQSLKYKEEALDNQDKVLITLSIIFIVLFSLISFIISRVIIKSFNNFRNGLLSFFSYLNKEKDEVEFLNDKSKDEFGEMSKVVNGSIKLIQENLQKDEALIIETVKILDKFKNGDLSQRINKDSNNPALNELKSVFNNMGHALEENINNILHVLEKYTKLDYLDKVDSNNLEEHLLKLAFGVNNLGDSITEMLIENKSNGLTLDRSSNMLIENVNKLNINSNKAAVSLEETSASLEQITSNIRNNTQNIEKMASYSNSVTISANEGEKLANQTTLAMEEINEQVNSINEAITVIDQISFQTNILSLNAAVEAATAGEAGKGFAVVAAEVRNLANRSADAAREIKTIVENARKKADDGKQIANNMIKGYKELNENIQQTINLISNIEISSKEQLSGIEQINDAVTELDQQTQQYASVASQTHDVSIITDRIAKLVVTNANNKEFHGKDDVKAKKIKNI
ncbi:MAG: methyl-accepting chemotaxis protein [Aliarcobacter sp.]|nr:methyl-accepting chemotaxis protein [Aliarcobacter sp.]